MPRKKNSLARDAIGFTAGITSLSIGSSLLGRLPPSAIVTHGQMGLGNIARLTPAMGSILRAKAVFKPLIGLQKGFKKRKRKKIRIKPHLRKNPR